MVRTSTFTSFMKLDGLPTPISSSAAMEPPFGLTERLSVFGSAMNRASASPIGLALMDQSVIAGVGNVYRAESLFVHGIHSIGSAADAARGF